MKKKPLLPSKILKKFEVHNFRHALEILATSYPEEFEELVNALTSFKLTKADITDKGGNESKVPKKLSALLRPFKWYETRIRGDLVVTIETHVDKKIETAEEKIDNYLDGHKIDYVKNKVAFDLEWNSKDQTFDRDLYAFRAFYEAGVISVAVLLTRSESLNTVFKKLNVLAKYGASTTWMGKLLYRVRAGRSGGCPLLVLGITPKVIKG